MLLPTTAPGQEDNRTMAPWNLTAPISPYSSTTTPRARLHGIRKVQPHCATCRLGSCRKGSCKKALTSPYGCCPVTTYYNAHKDTHPADKPPLRQCDRPVHVVLLIRDKCQEFPPLNDHGKPPVQITSPATSAVDGRSV